MSILTSFAAPPDCGTVSDTVSLTRVRTKSVAGLTLAWGDPSAAPVPILKASVSNESGNALVGVIVPCSLGSVVLDTKAIRSQPLPAALKNAKVVST